MQKSICVQRPGPSYENVRRHDLAGAPSIGRRRIRAARTKQKLSAMLLLHRRNDAPNPARARLSDLVTAHQTAWLAM